MNKKPTISEFYKEKQPSCIRKAQIMFAEQQAKRKQNNEPAMDVVNVAIGNVSLPTHPKMIKEYLYPTNPDLRAGVWKYTATVGTEKCGMAFINIINSFIKGKKPKLYAAIENGSSPLMKLSMLGVCGNPCTGERPLLGFDPVYTNYIEVGKEIGRKVVSLKRSLNSDGTFSVLSVQDVETAIQKYNPGALLIIPYDNPSGQFLRQETINEYAKLCMKYGLYLISDEAYRGLLYTDDEISTVWNITDHDIPGIEQAGIRISLETMSKVFNACGLRMGALVTDSKEFFVKAVAANTTYLCASAIDQNLVSVFADESHEEIQTWVKGLRDYYKRILVDLHNSFNALLPGIIASQPESSIYIVVDVRNIAKPGFSAEDFVKFCAIEGKVDINGKETTLLVAPMTGFYNTPKGEESPGITQMRIAAVEPEEQMKIVPKLFAELFREFEKGR
ncbi:MAG: aminotransferase class I/II-fold pyridoxal phosphate-dependent enzyme [Nanoarchaeota archaeon]|nr:aminotransferase class I/II-fold pyridoxal phosphate-dependent enzyme [Nanoarchaeota archaeon]